MADNKTIQLKLELQTKLAEANMKQTEVAINKLTQSFKKLTKGTNEYKAAQAKLAQLQVKYAKQTTSYANSLNSAATATTGVSSASGSASSSVLEMGRAISDSNYGIQGMANNLSQLASNLLFTVKKAGGLSGGLKAIGSAFLGPLGLIVVFQTAIALIERMAMSAGSATKGFKELKEATAQAGGDLRILLDQVERGNITNEDLAKSVNKANQEYKDLNIQLDENGKLTAHSVEMINQKIVALENLAFANAVQEEAEKRQAEVVKLTLKSREKFTESQLENARKIVDADKKAREEFLKNGANLPEMFSGQIDELQEGDSTRAASDFLIRLDEAKDKVSEVSDLLGDEGLVNFLFEGKNKGSGRNRADKIFKAQVLDLQRFILQQERSAEKSKERNVMNLLEIDQRYAREDLELTYNIFVEKQKLRFKQYVESEAKRKNLTVEQFKNTKQYADEEAKLNKSLADADNEYRTAVYDQKLAQEAAYQRKRLEIVEKFNDLMLKASLKSAQVDAKAQLGMYDGSRAGSLGNPQNKVGADGIASQTAIQENLMAIEQKNFEDSLAIKLERLQQEGMLLAEAEAVIAEDRFQFQTNMATRELDLERQKIQAKKNINQEYVSWVQGLSNVFKSVAGENKALATAALVLEKGAAIAKVVISTTAANREILATSGKEAGKLALTGKANLALGAGLAITNPIQGAALMKAGSAQVATAGATKAEAATRVAKNKAGAAISIASILATTLQSKGGGGSSSSGGGSGSGGRTFDFNLVGSTGENQLAQGIAGQFGGTPVQAYVVASQVTSQQELDNQIQGTATLGG